MCGGRRGSGYTWSMVGAARIVALVSLLTVVAACGSSTSTATGPIGAGLRGPGTVKATVYARGLQHVSALALDRSGRLWATTSGASTHAADGVYVVTRPGARAVKVVDGLDAPLGLVSVGDRLVVSSLGRVTAYAGFDGRALPLDAR